MKLRSRFRIRRYAYTGDEIFLPVSRKFRFSKMKRCSWRSAKRLSFSRGEEFGQYDAENEVDFQGLRSGL